jgi:cell wall-associated NlpC family hydrolase
MKRFPYPLTAFFAALLAVCFLSSLFPTESLGAFRSKKKSAYSRKYSTTYAKKHYSRYAKKRYSRYSYHRFHTKYRHKVKKKRYSARKYKHKRRVHRASNTTAGRLQALAYLQSSRELSSLALLEYKPDPNLQQFLDNDSEEWGDGHFFSDGDPEDEAEEVDDAHFTADVKSFQKLWLSYMKANVDSTEEETFAEHLVAGSVEPRTVINHILQWIGTPYYYGGTQRSGIDCSAFTQAVYRASARVELPRTAAMQSTVGDYVRRKEDLRFGDLIFFNTRSAVYVSHVGIYLGDNLFAHASSRYGVTVSSLQADYYKTRYLGAKRLRPEDLQVLAASLKYSSLLDTKADNRRSTKVGTVE